MSKFVLTAQLQLQAPKNTKKVLDEIRRGLAGGVDVDVRVKGAAAAKKQIQTVTNATNEAASSAQNMGKSFGLAFKRFAAFTIASRAVSLFTNTLANSVDEAIDFQREMVKISQVTGKTLKELKSLEKTINQLATSLGVSSRELLQVTRILSQAGLRATELELALTALAKTNLAPTFDDMTETAEGAVAIMAQFGEGAQALERQLGSINAVAGKFAVESKDLIGAIRRVGGVFVEAGGDLEDLLGLFTSIRATTRESSESIQTGLRTIFTRIQRPRTIEFLKQFGVELTDLNGKFVGPREAIKRLNHELRGLGEGDIRFIKIAEEIAGFRQIGKVLPLIKEFELAERARQEALAGGTSLTDDAATAQIALAVQITKVKEEFAKLIRGISQTGTFQAFIKTGLTLAETFIKVADALKPLIPLLATLATFKAAKAFGGFASGFGSAIRGMGSFDPKRKARGGKIHHFARGGMVPGTGNRDTVPAMLQPGEFVIRKSSVNNIGAGALASMNENKYAKGTEGRGVKRTKRRTSASDPTNPQSQVKFALREGKIGGFILKPAKGVDSTYIPQKKEQPFTLKHKPTINRLMQNRGIDPKTNAKAAAAIQKGVPALLDVSAGFPEFYAGARDLKKAPLYSNIVDRGSKKGLKEGIKRTAGMLQKSKLLNFSPAFKADPNMLNQVTNEMLNDDQVVSTMSGYLFEGMISAVTGATAAGGQSSFDFPSPGIAQNREKLLQLFGDSRIGKLRKAEAKRNRKQLQGKEGILNKTFNDINKHGYGLDSGVRLKSKLVDAKSNFKYMAKGGPAGSDTVPALLTPGEFVVNKSAAQSIGYGNLNTMNKKGTARFNKGGAVGIQRFNNGGEASGMQGMAMMMALPAIGAALESMTQNADGTSTALSRVIGLLNQWVITGTATLYMLKEFGIIKEINFKSIKTLLSDGPDGAMGMLKTGAESVKKKLEEMLPSLGKFGKIIGQAGAGAKARAVKAASGAAAGSAVGTAGGKVVSDAASKQLSAASVSLANSFNTAKGAVVGHMTMLGSAIASAAVGIFNFVNSTTIGGAAIKLLSGLFNMMGATIGFGNTAKQAENALITTSIAQKAAENTIQAQIVPMKALEYTQTQAMVGQNAGLITSKNAEIVSSNSLIAAKGSEAVSSSALIVSKGKETIAGIKNTAAKLIEGKTIKGLLGLRKAEAVTTKALTVTKGAEEATSLGLVTSKIAEGTITDGLIVRKGLEATASDGLIVRKGAEVAASNGVIASKAREIVSTDGVVAADTVRAIATRFSTKSTMMESKQRLVNRVMAQAEATAKAMGIKTQFAANAARLKEVALSSSHANLEKLLIGLKFKQVAATKAVVVSQKAETVQNYLAASSEAAENTQNALAVVTEGGENAMNALAILTEGGENAMNVGAILTEGGENAMNLAAVGAEGAEAIINTMTAATLAMVAVNAVGAAAALAALSLGATAGASVAAGTAVMSGGLGIVAAGTGAAAGAAGAGAGAGATAAGGTGGTALIAGPTAAAGGASLSIAALIGGLGLLVVAFSAIVSAALDLEQKVKNLTEEFGYLEEASGSDRQGKLDQIGDTAVRANQNGLIQLFSALPVIGQSIANGWQHMKGALGGDSVAKIQARAKSEAVLGQIQMQSAKNIRDADQALIDFKDGTIDATEALAIMTKNQKLKGEAAGLVEEQATATRAERSGLFGTVTRGFIRTMTGGIAGMLGLESGAQRNERLELEAKKLDNQASGLKQEELEAARNTQKQFAVGAIMGDQSFDTFRSENAGLFEGIEGDQLDTLRKDYENQSKAIQENIAYINSLNFGLRDVAAAANMVNISMGGLAQAQEAGFNSFAYSAEVLEQSVTAAGAKMSDVEFDQAMGDLEQSMRTFGASEGQIKETTGTVSGIRDAQSNTSNALEAAKQKLIEQGANTQPEQIKQALGDELLKNVEGPAKDRIKAALGKLDIDEAFMAQIKAGDVSGIVEEVLDPVSQAVTEQAIEQAKKRGEAENKLIDAVNKRRESEIQLIDAQKKAIDTQLEAAKSFEEFGGSKLTTDMKLGARTAQANLSLADAGIGGLGSGSASEIRRASADIQGKALRQANAVQFGTLGMARDATDPATGKAIGPAFANAAGIDENKQEELKTANKALVDFTRQRLDLVREELKIAEQKNKAEKDALDSLLAGDIEKFLEQQMAAGAATALRIGDAGLAKSFGAGALGAGFKTLEGQGLTDREKENAASMTLGSVGIKDPRAAQVMAGTTAEQESLKAQGRELSGVLGDLAQDSVDLAQLDVNTDNVFIEANKIELGKFTNPGGDGNIGDPRGPDFLARGGMVYANRGMFVPKGTDTVPAMLTPGEFVVNAAAVRRGNNLAMLSAMNGGMGMGGAAGMGMSRGGMVYMANGGFLGRVKDMMSGDMTGMLGAAMKPVEMMKDAFDGIKDVFNENVLKSFTGDFGEAVSKLMGMELSVKVDPTNVNVNFNGANFLQGLRDDIKNELLEKVREEIKNGKINESGDFQTRPGGLA